MRLVRDTKANLLTRAHLYDENKPASIATLQPLVQAKVVTQYMATKITTSTLAYCYLELAFQSDRECGTASL